MAEDVLVIDVDYDVTKAEAKQKRLQKEFDLAKLKLEQQKKTVEALREKTAQLANEAVRYRAELDGSKDVTDKQIAKLEKLEIQSKKTGQNYLKQKSTLEVQKAKLEELGMKLKENTAQTKKQNIEVEEGDKRWEKQLKSTKNFGKRLLELTKSALIFSVFTKALTNLKNGFSDILSEDKKVADSLKDLKANMSTLGNTFLVALKPAILWVVNTLSYITSIISQVMAKALGKNVNEIRAMSKETKKVREESEKATASFDTLNTAKNSESDSNDNGSNTTNWAQLSDEKLTEIAILSEMAMIGLGLILMLSGVNIPLGLFLVVTGGLLLYKTLAENWNKMSDKTKSSLAKIMTIAGASLFVIGLILVLCGILPLGIGLMVLGAAAVGGAVAINSDAVVSLIQGPLGKVLAIAGASMFAIGLVLALCGVIPIGVGLMIAGAAAFGISYKFNGEKTIKYVEDMLVKLRNLGLKMINWVSTNIYDKLFGKGFGESLKDMFSAWEYFFKDVKALFVAFKDGDVKEIFRAIGNIFIDLMNMVLSNINMCIQFLLGGGAKLLNAIGKVFGAEWNLDASNIKIPLIPRLATGAVIPGGSPFMAMLGDQRKGQTNIETPLDTMIEAFTAALDSRPQSNFTIEATGSMAQLIKLLNLKVTQEQRRASVRG